MKPNLSIVPEWDDRMRELAEAAPACFVCRFCSHVVRTDDKPSLGCDRCGDCDWTEARLTVDDDHPLR